MADRNYCILVAKTLGGLQLTAGDEWTVLGSTVREFVQLETDDDQSLGNIGEVEVGEPGFVALGYKTAS
jgi:hypothetical protein